MSSFESLAKSIDTVGDARQATLRWAKEADAQVADLERKLAETAHAREQIRELVEAVEALKNPDASSAELDGDTLIMDITPHIQKAIDLAAAKKESQQ